MPPDLSMHVAYLWLCTMRGAEYNTRHMLQH
jgi:hypothetical protein